MPTTIFIALYNYVYKNTVININTLKRQLLLAKKFYVSTFLKRNQFCGFSNENILNSKLDKNYQI